MSQKKLLSETKRSKVEAGKGSVMGHADGSPVTPFMPGGCTEPDDRMMPDTTPAVLSISAITLATHDMSRAVRFYRALGFQIRYGGEASPFTSFSFGSNYLNLTAQPSERQWSWWGRVIFYVEDVDAFFAHAVGKGLETDTQPRDAEWGERYFHITDPDGHELSFARPIK